MNKPETPTEARQMPVTYKMLENDIAALRRPWRAVDDQDWNYIMSVIGDGGRDRFWKAVLTEMRTALEATE
jgi:hypothetical protein